MTGNAGLGRAAVVRQVHRARWRSCSCCCPGIGPVIAWRHATAANLRRNLLRPAAVGVGRGACCCWWPGVTRLGRGAADVRPGGVRGRRGRAGALARRARAAGDVRRLGAARARAARPAQPPPLRRLHRARRRRRCCSSAWRPRRRSRTPTTSRSASGRRAKVGGYEITYVKPTADLRGGQQRPAREDRPRRRRCGCRRDGKTVGTLHTEQLVLPHRGPDARPGLALLRGRGDERGRPARRPAARRLERDHAQHARPAAADRRGRQGLHRGQGPAREPSARSRSRRRSTGLTRSLRQRTRRRRRSG